MTKKDNEKKLNNRSENYCETQGMVEENSHTTENSEMEEGCCTCVNIKIKYFEQNLGVN